MAPEYYTKFIDDTTGMHVYMGIQKFQRIKPQVGAVFIHVFKKIISTFCVENNIIPCPGLQKDHIFQNPTE